MKELVPALEPSMVAARCSALCAAALASPLADNSEVVGVLPATGGASCADAWHERVVVGAREYPGQHPRRARPHGRGCNGTSLGEAVARLLG